MNPYIITRHGHKVHFMRPHVSEIDIRDIAHALSRIVRFNSHTLEPYYVLQHVCLCSDAAPTDCKREALSHDWAESYVGDCPSPLKTLIPQFGVIEARLEKVIARKFHYRFPYPDAVKEVDMRLLVTELRDLTRRSDWKDYPFTPLDQTIAPWDSETCKREFMKRYHRLFS